MQSETEETIVELEDEEVVEEAAETEEPEQEPEPGTGPLKQSQSQSRKKRRVQKKRSNLTKSWRVIPKVCNVVFAS